jgi:hypothetical protein
MKKNNKVTFFGFTLTLTEDPHIIMGKYRSSAIDAKGNKVMVAWAIKGDTEVTDYNIESACDWENPSDIYPIQ